MPCQTVVAVSEISQVGEARRAAADLSLNARFSESAQGRLALIVTELATNLVRHARSGKVLLQEHSTAAGPVIEVLSIDSGPGITDIGAALKDGFSTAGTAGNGLGAIRRMSNDFDIFSEPGRGTVIMSRVANLTNAPASGMSLLCGVIRVPAPGETECGDSWSLFSEDGFFSLVMADGLGHGPDAAKAADRACDTFVANPRVSPPVFLQNANIALGGTRGAAVAIASCKADERLLRFAGIGNISGSLIFGADRRGLSSHNGTIGVQTRKIQEFQYPCSNSGLLVMHSDGLQNRWSLDDYPGLVQRHPAVLAGVLYRDFLRGPDDMTVVVVRWTSGKD